MGQRPSDAGGKACHQRFGPALRPSRARTPQAMPSQAAGIRCTGVSRLEATAAKGSRAHLLDPNTAIFPGFLAADRIGPLKTLDVLTIR